MPLTLDTLTMFPLVVSRWGTAIMVRWYTALMLVPITRSYCSRLVFSMLPISRTPALFTSTSSLPNLSTV